jgi:uncharacterized membrane protein
MSENPPKPSKLSASVAAANMPSSLSAFHNQPQIQFQGQIQQSTFAGPLPHPDVLAKYNDIQPGFADRIIKMAEAEGEHRRNQEKRSLDSDIKAREIAQETDLHTIREGFRLQRLGQFCALIIGVFTVAAGTYAAVHGALIAGTFIGSTGVIGLVSVFIWGRERSPSTNPPTKPNENS